MFGARNIISISSKKSKSIFCHGNKLDYSNDISATSAEKQIVSTTGKPKVAICGGGITGASVAYHLSQKGWGDNVVLIEQNRIGSGCTKYSPGLVGLVKPSWSELKFSQESIRLWKHLQSKSYDTGWSQCGSLFLAKSRDRMTEYRRMNAQFLSWHVECELVSPEKCKEINPLLQTDDVIGGLYFPNDGIGDPYKTCSALIEESKLNGLNVIENCSVTNIGIKNGKVSHIQTSMGDFECDYFINCAGFHSRNVGRKSEPNIRVPLYAAKYYYIYTKPIQELNDTLPVVRDPDAKMYFRQKNGKLLIGGYRSKAKAMSPNAIEPFANDNNFTDDDWDNFQHIIEEILLRIPMLKDVILDKFCKYPEMYSPDSKWIIGESPEVQNYFVAGGTNISSLSTVGGIGKVIADVIIDGFSKHDLHDIDISRFLSLHNNEKFLKDRVQEVPGMFNDIQYPFQEFKTGRNLRMSPIYLNLSEKGAIFNQVMGYERPAWFDHAAAAQHDSKKIKIAQTNTFGKPPWFDFVKEEYTACREAIGLCDYSSFTKFDLMSKNREIVDFLQYLCSNDVDIPLGCVIHTGMQNEHGGYENDCSLVRLAENRYMMIAPTIQQTRCKMWIERRLTKDGSIKISDVTSMYTAICLMGPFTRILLSELTDTDLTASNFPFFTFKELDVGLANGIRALNLTHTGELGYVLYIPNEFALHVYTRLIKTGQKYGIKHVGYYAMRTLRVEKFYAFWGQDLDTVTTPLECGRAWRVKFNKPTAFIGKDALLKQREEGIKRQYVQLILNDHDPETELWSWGGEPIYRNGIYCGQTTTTSYGYTFQKQVCLGFVQKINEEGHREVVNNKYILSGDYEVDIAGIRYNAKVNLHSPNLPTKYPDQERESYQATRDKIDGLHLQ